MDISHIMLGLLCGGMVGFTMGRVGGGGSVLSVPLMLYVVGVQNPHVALGTTAFAVAVNAITNLITHARLGHVKWRCGGMFGVMGSVGALLGSTAGKAFNGQHLLLLFALVMLVIAGLMFRGRGNGGDAAVECRLDRAPKVAGYALTTGAFSGFFGIGGGFLIVPGLIGATNMPIINAVGTSLVAVIAFGLTTALNYAVSGLVDWELALVFILGGTLGGVFGTRAARRLAARRGQLNIAFAGMLVCVALYMLARTV